MSAAPASRTLHALLAAGLALALFAGCGTARRSAPLVGPMVTSDPTLQRGHVAFDRHCYKCHGEGDGALAPGMNHLPLPRPLMRLQVRVGLGAMPSFSESELSDEDLDAIVDYLVALRRHGG